MTALAEIYSSEIQKSSDLSGFVRLLNTGFLVWLQFLIKCGLGTWLITLLWVLNTLTSCSRLI